MADENDTLTVIAEQLALALQPLTEAFSSTESMIDFLEELGWVFNSVPAALNSIQGPADAVQNVVESSGESLDSNQVNELIELIAIAFNAIGNLESAGGLANDFKDEFPHQLVQYLIVDYLIDNQPVIAYILIILGIIRLEEVPTQGGRVAYLKRVFAFEDFGELFNDPLVFFKNAYKWKTSQFEGEKLLSNIYGLLTSMGFSVYEEGLSEAMLDELNKNALLPNDAFDTSLKIAFLEDSLNTNNFSTGLGIFLLPETTADRPGFALLPYASEEIEEALELSENLELEFQGGLDLTGGLGVLMRPQKDIKFQTGFGAGVPSGVEGNLDVLLRLTNNEGPIMVVGSTEASCFKITSLSTKAGTRFHSGGKYEIFTEFALEEGRIIIKPDPSETDGFLSTLLPEEGMEIEINLGVGFSSTQGLYFAGSGGVEVRLPLHVELGPIGIESALIAIKPKVAEGGEPFKVPLELAVTIKADFGILKCIVENIGLQVDFKFPENGKGNLGQLDLGLGFRTPNGVGLSIDAGPVKGGGYLYFDFDKEEYAGFLELDLNGIVSVKAIGLITTKMPDGSKGFSLLMIITAEFGSPIQLGLGFTLSAVGGLLGLNRSMCLDVIATGIRDGGINSIMFPQNVVANAPRIISDLKKYFPAEDDTFLIGPMVKIGWGTPNLVTVSMAVIIEVPGDVAILGVLKVALPDEEHPVIVINVNFMGAIESDKKRLWFFASLYDSRVQNITLEGQMGLLVAWGDNANFVVSVGGFHPAFNPPPLPFGSISRIAISILNKSFARIRLEGYFAVTSNSVQFGARVEVFFGLSACKVDGHLAFDALFLFSPFYFEITISASMSVKVFGVGMFSVRIRGSLEGPTPWRVEGTGSISFLFFDVDADFSHTWGNVEDTTLPPISVMPILINEYQKLENWQAKLPSGSQLLVSLRSFEQGPTDLILHPVGSLKVSQRAVPLGITIDKVGNQKPSDANHFDVTVNSTDTIKKIDDIEESFAVGQYLSKSSNELLSAKAFEPMKGGMELSVAGEQYNAPQAVKRVVRYEQIIIDTNYKRLLKKLSELLGALFGSFLNGNAASQSVLSQKQKKRLKPFDDKVEVGKVLYSVALNSNNTAFNDDAVDFTSQVQAQEYMKQKILVDANLAKHLHVIPKVEMRKAA